MIRENISSPEQLAITLAHERGHHGLSALLGDRMPAVLNRLWTNPATRTRIKAKMAAFGMKFGYKAQLDKLAERLAGQSG